MKKKSVFVLMTIYESFQSYRIQLLSATQTYYTLLAVVPVIALIISIAETLHLSAFVESWISHIFIDQKEVATYLINFAKNAVSEAKKTSFKVFGIVLLFWAAVKMLLYVDVGINQLWGNPSKPNFLEHKFRFIIILASTFFLFIIAGTWSFFLTVTLNFFLKQTMFHAVTQWIIYASNLLPSFLLMILLSFLYYYVPYVKIRISSALLAGFLIAIAYQIFQAIYFTVQIIVSNYNTIYGTFAALPLFLVWVHMNWVIFFMGAKLCYSLEKQIDD